LFVGARIEGQGGVVAVFRAKELYFQKLIDAVQKDVELYNELREEIYVLLNDFLSQCVVPNSLCDMQKWLYYVKTDVVFQSMAIESNGLTFFFDASSVEYKKNNERRNVAYELKEAKDNTINFIVYYREGKVETDIKAILEVVGDKITETELKKIFKKYERKIKQTERDFFIHKDIRYFLREQLKQWLGEYVYNKELMQEDVKKLQITKEIVHKLIDMIDAFEDEVLKLWNMPKSVVNANYVITLDRISMHGNTGW